ncbi:proline-rich protein 36-like [Chaetodon trifascialis]|uniref:proline-rich protein 36-like n=1 Tax=Chaetodon trifascialis TaxID=109706 RepID=UPI003992AD09
MSHPNRLPPHSPMSSLSAGSDVDLDSVIDVSAPMLSSQTKTLLVLSQSASSNSNLMANSPSPSNSTTTPSLTSVNTVLDHKSSKSPSPLVERVSPSNAVSKFSSETVSKGSASFHDLDFSFSTPPPLKNLTPPLSAPKTPSPLPATLCASPPSAYASSKASTPSPLCPPMVSSQPAFSSPQSAPPAHRASPLAVQQPPVEQPSLDEALDKLLAMSFAQNHTAAQVEEPQLRMEAHCLGRGMQEVQEELILPLDRNSIHPDTFTSATNTITDESVDGGTDGNGDLDWADEELSMSFHDGLDGTMTPYTERPYTDGSMTPLTEASWMDESMTPSSCPGTPDVALDLPLLQTPSIDRVSASGHIKSVIRRTKETPNVHPMYRDAHLRRKMGPIIVNKNTSQDRLIEELQGKFGIGRPERRRKQSDDWLTEGVVVTSKPQRFRLDGAGSEVDKIIIPPESPVPVRKVLPPPSPPAPRRPPVVEEPKQPLPVQQPPVPIPPPPPPPPPSPPPQPPHIKEPAPAAPRHILKASPAPDPIQEPPAPKPQPPPPVLKTPTQPPPVEPVTPVTPKVLVSVGCQTEYDPIFPPMQA